MNILRLSKRASKNHKFSSLVPYEWSSFQKLHYFIRFFSRYQNIAIYRAKFCFEVVKIFTQKDDFLLLMELEGYLWHCCFRE